MIVRYKWIKLAKSISFAGQGNLHRVSSEDGVVVEHDRVGWVLSKDGVAMRLGEHMVDYGEVERWEYDQDEKARPREHETIVNLLHECLDAIRELRDMKKAEFDVPGAFETRVNASAESFVGVDRDAKVTDEQEVMFSDALKAAAKATLAKKLEEYSPTIDQKFEHTKKGKK